MPVLLLYRTRYTPEQFAKVDKDAKRTGAKLKRARAGAPITIWQRPDIPEAHLTLLEYDNLEVAERGFDAYTSLASSIRSSGFQGEGAPDALLLDVHSHGHSWPQDAPIGSFLSLSTRIADPGYATELLADLDMVFQELNLMDGFLGWAYGNRVGVAEEMLSIALWSKLANFESSVPVTKGHTELRVYRRVL